MRVWIVANLIQPVVWLILFTQVFTSIAVLPELGGHTYLDFFAPGVVVMTIMFGSAWAGMGLLSDIQKGILGKMMATPASRTSILFSRILSSVFMLLVQALIILVIAAFMGVRIITGAAGLLMVIVLISLLGFGFAAFSTGLAILLKRSEPLVGIVNFLALPIVFLSSVMMPADLLPSWLNAARHFNPLDYAVVGVRDLVLTGWVWSEVAVSAGVLSVWALAGIMFGIYAFRRGLG